MNKHNRPKAEINTIAFIQSLTARLRKKDSDMKIDKTTYKDKEENQNGLTADHTSQPDKVLLFADPHFLIFKSRHTLYTLASSTSRHTNQNLPKSAILLTL